MLMNVLYMNQQIARSQFTDLNKMIKGLYYQLFKKNFLHNLNFQP